MTQDVELLRTVLLYLETRQVSPRATVILDLAAEARDLGCPAARFAEALGALSDLAYIEGPGPDGDGVWLFRKLTAKGMRFVRASADLADWERLKRRYRRIDAAPDPGRH